MEEAHDNKYFIDGFLIRHFQIFPGEMDKNNLFEQQKIFLIYLMGIIPNLDEWRINVDYQLKLQEIKNLTVKDIHFEQAELDVWSLHGYNIEEKKIESLKREKEKRLKELDKLFGKNSEQELLDKVRTLENMSKNLDKRKDRQTLWDFLQGKGLIKEKENA